MNTETAPEAEDSLESRMLSNEESLSLILSKEFDGLVGYQSKENQIWINDHDNFNYINIAGCWIYYAQEFFKWRKISCLGQLPLVAYFFGGERNHKIYSKLTGGKFFDDCEKFRGTASRVIINPFHCVQVYFREKFVRPVSVYLTFDETLNENPWTYTYYEPTINEYIDYKSPKEYHHRVREIHLVKDWWTDSMFSVSSKAIFAPEDLFKNAVCIGDIELTGRVKDATSERIKLDPDWFNSPVVFERDRTSLTVGDTRIWNVEARLNPNLMPEGMVMPSQDEEKGIKAIQQIRTMSPQSERELQDWIKEFQKRHRSTPTETDFELWRKSSRFSRSSFREAQSRLDPSLKRKRGRPPSPSLNFPPET